MISESLIKTRYFCFRLDLRKSETKIPGFYRLGTAYRDSSRVFSFEITYSEPVQYFDLESTIGRSLIRHQGTLNVSAGMELKLRKWLKWRFGLFSNNSTVKEPQTELAVQQPAKVNMWGFSSNIGLYSSDNISWSLGGFYTGGRGNSIQQIGPDWIILPKDQQVFSFVLGTSYAF